MNLRSFFTQRSFIFYLVLIALTCVPLAARQIVRDAGISLLLPVTLFGLLAAWGLASVKAGGVWKGLDLVLGGMLFLFLYVGQIGGTLMAACRASLLMASRLIQGYQAHVAVDITEWAVAQSQLGSQVNVLWGRTFLWVTQFWRGEPVEDPTARALVWSVGLWLIAIWAGWQVRGRDQALTGLFPATLLLGLVVNSNRQEIAALWIHLGAVLILFGLMQFESSLRKWEQAHNDYVEETKLDSITATVLLASLLILMAYLASNISIQRLIDELREKREASRTTQNSETDASSQPLTPFSAEDFRQPHRITGNPKLTDDVVMIISTGDLPPMPSYAHPDAIRYYWRTTTYDTYSWIGWSNLSVPLLEVPARETLLDATPPDYRVVHEQVRFPSGAAGQLYWTGSLLRVDAPLQVAWRRQATINDPFFGADLLGALTSATSYNAESLRLEVNEADLRKASTTYPAWIRRRYLTLPDSVPERVLALARNLTSTAATPYDRARAIETYLRQFPYTLDVPAPPPGGDPADYFLFDLKKGYCDYYATAMVVLSRAAGLPTRFVTGYSSGSYDSENGYYVVTRANAHSWTEVYFPEIGWVEFEPTASLPLPDRQGEYLPAISKVVEPQALLSQQIRLFFNALFSKIWLPIAIVILLALLWLPIGNLFQAHFHTQQAIQYFYKRLRQTARPLMGPLLPSQTLHEYAATLTLKLASLEYHSQIDRWLAPAHAEIWTLTDLYTRSLFTLYEPLQAEVINAARIWSCLYWRLLLSSLLFKLGRRLR